MEDNTQKIIDLIKSGSKENLELVKGFFKNGLAQPMKYFSPLRFIEQEFGIDISIGFKDYPEFNGNMNQILQGLLLLGGLPIDLIDLIMEGSEAKINVEGWGTLEDGYDGFMVNDAEKVLRKFHRNEMEIGFKYIYTASDFVTEISEIEKIQKKFMKSLDLFFVETISISKTWGEPEPIEYDIYATKDLAVFFQFKKGRMVLGEYSSMYAFDIKRGLEVANKIFQGKTNVTYIKSVEMFVNGLSNCSYNEIKEMRQKINKVTV